MAIDGCFSIDEQAYILLAYYLGRQKLLNCIALQQITQDLITLFEAKPRNHSTKYFDTEATCCLCKEKEVIFKKLWKDYHEQKGTKLDPVTNDEAADKVWQDILKFWADVEERNETLASSEANLLLGFEQACKDVLQKHKVHIYSDIKRKFTEEQDFNNWISLISSVKKKMKCCRKAIYTRSGNVTAGVSTLGFTKHDGLQNVLLTFLLNNRARVYAKRLQSCRTSGLMIRATRDPMAVVAKYFVCNKCIGKEEDPSEGFHSILDVLRMFSDHLGTGKKGRTERTKSAETHSAPVTGELESEAYGNVGHIEVLMGENVLKHATSKSDASTKDQAGHSRSESSTRKSKRVQMSNRKYTTFVYDLSDEDTDPEDGTLISAFKRPVKRRASMLAKKPTMESIRKHVVSAKRRRSAPMKLTAGTQTSPASQVPPCDKTNVIIVTTTLPSASKPGVGIPQLAPITFSHLSSEKSKVLTTVPIRPYIAAKPKPELSGNFAVTLKGGAAPKPRRMSAGSAAGAGTKFVLIPAPNTNALNIGSQSGVLKVLQCPPLQTRERSVSLDSQPMGGVFLQKGDVEAPKLVGGLKPKADPATPTGMQTSPQGSVVVRVVDGAIKFCGSGSAPVVSKPASDPKARSMQVAPRPLSSPVVAQNKIQLTSGGVKIIKSVAVTAQQPSSSKHGGFIRLNPPPPQQFINLKQDGCANFMPALGKARGKIVVENINRLPFVKVAGSSSLNIPKVLPSFGKNMVFKEVKVQLNGPPARPFQSLSLAPLLQSHGQKLPKVPRSAKYDHRTPSPSDGTPCQTPKKVNAETLSRSAGKKKTIRPPSKSIALVVAEFIQSLIPSEQKEPKHTKHRSKEIKPSLLMPVPYETHFLCIYDTLEKQGWKAYWYRKCRCSKLREKNVEADIDKAEHSVQPEEVVPWIPKQLGERSRLILSGKLVDEKRPQDVNPADISKVQKNLDFTADKISSSVVEIPKLKHLLAGDIKTPIIGSEYCQQNATQKLSALATAVLKRKLYASTEKPRGSEAPPKRLKAVYRRDKNGNWSSASQQLMQCGSDATVSDTVVLNIKPSKEFGGAQYDECANMEDRFGITHDHGLKRSARATMLRRKALVKRALEAQVRTKTLRDRSELAATQSCIFMQFSDASKTSPKFNMITPHALCYRSFPIVSVKVARRSEARMKETKELCIPPSDAELEAIRRKKEKQEQLNRQALLSYINSPMPSSSLKRSGKNRTTSLKKVQPTSAAGMIELNKEATEDKFEGKLIGQLESLWNDGSSSPVKAKPKATRKKMSVLQMLPRVQEAISRQPKRSRQKSDTAESSCSGRNEATGTTASKCILKTISQKHAEQVASTIMTSEEVVKKIPHTHKSLRTPWILLQNRRSDTVVMVERDVPATRNSIEDSGLAADTSSTAKPPTTDCTSAHDTSSDQNLSHEATIATVGQSDRSICLEAPVMHDKTADVVEEKSSTDDRATKESGIADICRIAVAGKVLAECELAHSTVLDSDSVKDVISPDTDSGLGPELPVVDENAGESIIVDGLSTTDVNIQADAGCHEENPDVPTSTNKDRDELSSYLDDLFPTECSDGTSAVGERLKRELLATENLEPENEKESPQNATLSIPKDSPKEKSKPFDVSDQRSSLSVTSTVGERLKQELLATENLNRGNERESSEPATLSITEDSPKEKSKPFDMSKKASNQASFLSFTAVEKSPQKISGEENCVSPVSPAINLFDPDLDTSEEFLGFDDADVRESCSHRESSDKCMIMRPAPTGESFAERDHFALSEDALCDESNQKCQPMGTQPETGSLPDQSLEPSLENPDASAESQSGANDVLFPEKALSVWTKEAQEAVADCVEYLLTMVEKSPNEGKQNATKLRIKVNAYPHTLVNYNGGAKGRSSQRCFLDVYALTAKLHGFDDTYEKKRVSRRQKMSSNRRFFRIYDELKRATKAMGKEKSSQAYRPKTDIEVEIQRRIRRVDKMSSFLGRSYTLSSLGEIFRDATQTAEAVKETKRNKENSRRRKGQRRASHLMVLSRQEPWIKSHIQQYFKRCHASNAVKKLKAIIGEPHGELIKKTHEITRSSTPKSIAGLSDRSCRPRENRCSDAAEDGEFPTPETARGMTFSRFRSQSEHVDQASVEGIGEGHIEAPCYRSVNISHAAASVSLSSDLNATQNPFAEEPASPGTGFLPADQPQLETRSESAACSPSSYANSDDRPTSPNVGQACMFTLGELAPVSESEKQPRKRRYGDISVGTLNGSYWSTELDVDDDAPSTSTQRPLGLRRRRNKQDDRAARYKKLNKRKRPGHGFYMSTKEQIGEIMDAERSLLERYDGGSLLETGSSDEDATETKPLRMLFGRCLNVERVRSWMRDTTSTKPFRLYLSKPPSFVKRVRVSQEVYSSHSDSSLSAPKKKNPTKTKSSAAKRREKHRDVERAYFSDSESQSRKVTVRVSSAPSLPAMRKPIVSLVRCSYPISPRRERRPEKEAKRTFSSPRGMSQICAKKTSSNMCVDAEGLLSLTNCAVSDLDQAGNLRLTRPYMSRKRRLVFSDTGDESGTELDADQSEDKARKITTSVPPALTDEAIISSSKLHAKVLVEQLRNFPQGADLHEAVQDESPRNEEACLRPRRRLVLRERASHTRDVKEKKGLESNTKEKRATPRIPARLAQKNLSDESPPVLRDHKKLQALRETVFNELKTKSARSRRRDAVCKELQTSEANGNCLAKSTGVDSRRPRLQSTCSTRGSFISRLIEFDSSDPSSENE